MTDWRSFFEARIEQAVAYYARFDDDSEWKPNEYIYIVIKRAIEALRDEAEALGRNPCGIGVGNLDTPKIVYIQAINDSMAWRIRQRQRDNRLLTTPEK